MQKEKISVLMPAFNAADFIVESIESLINQTFRDIEIYILDDCSSDNTRDIIESYSNKFHFINVYYNKENLGIAASRNKLLNLAKGDYIAWCDSDDLFHRNKLEIQYNHLQKNPNLFGVGTARNIINSNSELVNTLKINKINTVHDGININIVINNCFCNSTVLFKNENYRVSEFFPPAEDFEFYSRLILMEGKKFENLNIALVDYRIHDNNTSTKRKYEQLNLNYKIVKRNLLLLKNGGDFNYNYIMTLIIDSNPFYVFDNYKIKYILDYYKILYNNYSANKFCLFIFYYNDIKNRFIKRLLSFYKDLILIK